jgi:hypothetical protein
MTTWIVANLTLFAVVVVVGLLQRAHERYGRRPHAPGGSDAHLDADLRRVLHDLDASA